jgi:hypothetical protein
MERSAPNSLCQFPFGKGPANFHRPCQPPQVDPRRPGRCPQVAYPRTSGGAGTHGEGRFPHKANPLPQNGNLFAILRNLFPTVDKST